jgi:hypothetical protein
MTKIERNTAMQKLTSILFNSMVLIFVSSCVLSTQSSSQAQPLATITVEAGTGTRIDTPVSVALDGLPASVQTEMLGIVEIKGTERVPVAAQIESGNPPKLWWILSGTTPASESRTFELVLNKTKTAGGNIVKAAKNEKFLDIQIGDAKVLRYNHAIVPGPENMGKVPVERRPLYDRSGFIHPIWSPAGSVLTEIHPLDHIHHMGLWMPWTHTRYEGKRVDFWNVGDGTGTVRFAKYLSTTDGPVYGGFQAEQEHVARHTSEGEKVILKEVWDVRVYNVGGKEKGYWLIDFKSTQRNITNLPLIQEKYRYGGFGFRGPAEWKDEDAAYLTSEGYTRADANGTRARWCDTSGKIDDWEGITFYSNPKNFRHPEPMRVWPPEDRYVFFNFAPSQAGEWEMKPGEDHVFRYRMYVHEGKVNVDTAERVWKDYAEPPVVNIKFAQP